MQNHNFAMIRAGFLFRQVRKTSFRVSEFSTDKKKATLSPYLYFYGNGAEARDFYAEKFNGKVDYSTYFKDNEGACSQLSEDRKSWLMHACVTFGDNHVMMCDDASNTVHTVGTNVTLCVSYDDVDEMTKVFNGMSEGGTIQVPLAKQFWDATYGKLQDKFGVIWAFNCHHNTEGQDKKGKN